jgi:hypothetical protein
LATAHDDGTILIWTVPASHRLPWIAAEANELWDKLAADNAARAWESLWHLFDHADKACQLLSSRLKPISPIKDTAEQITRLDDSKYAVREEAMKELASRGESIEGDLLSAIKVAKSEEQRKRLEVLLTKLDPATPPAGDVLRGLRSIWLLERIGTPEARKLLEKMAGGATGSRVTIEAKAALERLTSSSQRGE